MEVFFVFVSEKIMSLLPELSKKHIALGKYIIDNTYDAALMNAPKIARAAGVSEATLTRFVYTLGYNNFSEFQAELTKEAIKSNSTHFKQEPYLDSNGSVCSKIFNMEMELMRETLSQIDDDSFDECVNLLCGAKKLLLVGGPTHDFIAKYALNFMSSFREDVHSITHVDMVFLSILNSIGPDSAAVVVSYPRYSTETQKITEALFEKGVQIIGVTDSKLSPLTPFAKYSFITPQKYVILADANASAITLMHAFMVAMYRKDPERIKPQLEEYEKDILTTDMFVYKDYNFAQKL